MRSTATTAIASAALVLLGCTLGLFLGRWMNSPPPESIREDSRAVAQQPDLSGVVAEIQQLRESMLRTLSNLEVASPEGSSLRDPVAPRSEDLNRLTVAIEKLSELVGQNAAPNRGLSSTLLAEKGPGFPSVDAVWARVKEISEGGDDSAYVGAVGEEMSRSHFAWTRDDVFDRYGTPSRIHVGTQIQPDHPILNRESGVSLVYERGERVVAFFVSEGLVTWVYSR